MPAAAAADRVVARIEAAADELVAFCQELIRIPTVNPPGEEYRACAELIGQVLAEHGHEVEYVTAAGRPEHTERHPRVNVLGRSAGGGGPVVHFNGHFDVVPAGEGWTVDPFGGALRDGRLYGRGSADMKAGLAAAIFAAEAVRRAGVELRGGVEISATVDEESGGFAGVAHLAEIGRISSERISYAIIPEPFSPHRVCIGHRGVYWARVTAHGRIAHGSMPWLGVSAIEQIGPVIEALRTRLIPEIEARRTEMPVTPAEARRGSLNLNAVLGGQAGDTVQSPCVADRCELIVDRRFLPEEGFEQARAEIEQLLQELEGEEESREYVLEDLMVVHPTTTPDGSPVVAALAAGVREVLGREPELVASPGTYDQKHFARLAGVEHCVAYGPGTLEQAHQPDEWCAVSDIVDATKVMALALLRLAG